MQLLIIVLSAFGLGYLFARGDGPQHVSDYAKKVSGLFTKKEETKQIEATLENSEK